MGDVTVIGCVQADVVMSPVSELPRAGGTQLTDQMSIRVGGAGANAALAFAETFFDTSWDPDGFGESTRREVRGLLASVDVFLPNEAEACALAGLDGDGGGDGDDDASRAAEAARALKLDTRGWVVVKLGARGCLAVGPDGTELTAPAPTVDIADTTGAGDAFNAGLVHALDGGASWPDALAAATRFASAIVSRPSHERYRSEASR